MRAARLVPGDSLFTAASRGSVAGGSGTSPFGGRVPQYDYPLVSSNLVIEVGHGLEVVPVFPCHLPCIFSHWVASLGDLDAA